MECKYKKVISLMSSMEKLKCGKVKAVLRYESNMHKSVEQYVRQLLHAFCSFCNERHLKSPPFSGTYSAKLQEPGVMKIICRNKLIIEPKGQMVEHALPKLHSHLTNPDAFSQQENDETEEK